MSDNKQNKSKAFPTKRDFWYSFSIAVLILIFMGAHLFKNDGLLANKLEFAATIVSIILAVIAIVMTLTEGYKNARANEEILDSSEKIKNSTEALGSLTEDIKNISCLSDQIKLIRENTEIINEAMEHIVKKAATKQDLECFKEINGKLDSVLFLGESKVTKPVNNIERIEEIIECLRDDLKKSYKICMYIVYKAYKEKLELSWIEHYLENTLGNKMTQGIVFGYAYLPVIWGLCSYTVNSEKNSYKVKKISEQFERFVNELIEKEPDIKEYVDNYIRDNSN